MFDKLRAKGIDLMKEVTIAVLPGSSAGISLSLAAGSVAMPDLEARWQTSRGGHLIVVGAKDRDQAPNRWAALVAHELFHAFQREVAHEQPHTAHRAYAFTTQQMEREAFIFQYSVFLELTHGTTDRSVEQQREEALASLRALTADVNRAREWLAHPERLDVYRLAHDDLHGNELEAIRALFRPPLKLR